MKLQLLLLGAALSGCGGSLCSRVAEFRWAPKLGKCNLTLTENAITEAACESAMPKCSESDRQTIAKTYDCAERLAVCQPGQEQAYLNQQNACLGLLRAMSTACYNAF